MPELIGDEIPEIKSTGGRPRTVLQLLNGFIELGPINVWTFNGSPENGFAGTEKLLIRAGVEWVREAVGPGIHGYRAWPIRIEAEFTDLMTRPDEDQLEQRAA